MEFFNTKSMQWTHLFTSEAKKNDQIAYRLTRNECKIQHKLLGLKYNV